MQVPQDRRKQKGRKKLSKLMQTARGKSILPMMISMTSKPCFREKNSVLLKIKMECLAGDDPTWTKVVLKYVIKD